MAGLLKSAAIGGSNSMLLPQTALGYGLNKLTNGTPEQQNVALDDQTKGLLQKQQDRANETAQDIVNRNTAGMDEKAQAFNDASQVSKPQENAALGLNSMADDLNKSLEARASRSYADNSAIAKTHALLGANDQMIRDQAQAAQAAQIATKQKINAFSIQLKNIAARKQARAQMLGSILGVAGQAGGMVVAPKNNAATPAVRGQ